MPLYYWLSKDGKHYQTQSKFLNEVCIKFKGYKFEGINYWEYGKLLPFTLSKEERDKYKVLLRIMK